MGYPSYGKRKDMKSGIAAFLLCVTWGVHAQTTKEVLFLGNSYTAVNNLPLLVSDIATSKGNTLTYDSNTPGGYTLNGHSTNTTSLAKINSNNWDYVVLQEQSQIPSFPQSQVATDCYPYADSLNRFIKENDSCTVTMFYMTWGRENGDASNCAGWPPVCTYDGMQAQLRESYVNMMGYYNAELSPVGAAWKYTRDNDPTIQLYTADESHPSIHGSYLAACVFYAAIFQETPVGAAFPATITSGDALILQQNAHAVVMDSLTVWNIGSDPCGVTTGVNEPQPELMAGIYPNPSSGSVILETDAPDARYAILDMLGKAVREGAFNTNTVQIENLGTGVYVIRLFSGTRFAQKLLVVK